VYHNVASEAGSNYLGGAFTYCCTIPVPDGIGNFDYDPLFADANGRLHSDSPCINSGFNPSAPDGTDLDGRPRVVGGTVDVGAYEFQLPQSAISYAWLRSYGLPTDGSADSTDFDGDGMTTWQEWRCRTDPFDALSALRLLSPSLSRSVCWQSVAGVTYVLERSTNLTHPIMFVPVARNLTGQPGTTCYTDTNSMGAPHLFYRVGVE
jgi:hypothetical protein